MDAQKTGKFIAQQRKKSGLTQAQLAQKLYITDKAVSRWERGIGLPDINLLEPLAQALNVKLIELVQAELTAADTISIKQAEAIVSDTIQLSKKDVPRKTVGITALGLFGIIILSLFYLLITDGSVVAYSVGSIFTGLIAWGMPIWQMTLAKTAKPVIAAIISFGTALTSLTIQFFQLAQNISTNDFAAIEDTIQALCSVVVLFCIITTLLNLLMLRRSGKK